MLLWTLNLQITPTGPSTLREAVYELLSDVPGVSGRITPYGRPQGQPNPSLTYTIVGRDFGHDLAGPSGVSTATLRVSCWSRKYSEAEATANSVRGLLDGFRGILGSVRILGCFLQDESDLPEQPRNGSDAYTYQIVLSFSVTHRT